jgi:hypothetical protein
MSNEKLAMKEKTANKTEKRERDCPYPPFSRVFASFAVLFLYYGRKLAIISGKGETRWRARLSLFLSSYCSFLFA